MYRKKIPKKPALAQGTPRLEAGAKHSDLCSINRLKGFEGSVNVLPGPIQGSSEKVIHDIGGKSEEK
uniref:Uncharacterized protein n=1 Tax=Candidatus Kentrum sp. SD TaxID=2126332 RepID=A0A450YIE1_9GAMM|nr:MAG: hypothetical protein BECKSD772F_GA0070984_101738 [Candidatus Kentron sp. SD]VFK41340.1 MAG: hypothetical protein BECKSD772E_GA0070983_101133 [Candidatus Kentron sp. SD]VFK80109.1 MAG: hypothetical protein BECKSD772D_GA0070982_10858 [Candidatus Kentron sp. SD]